MVKRIQPNKTSVKVYLLEWREYRGMTQDELAERIDTTNGAISRWENGKRDITVGVLAAIAEALHCHVVDLFRHPPS
jgi:transcriptional regulator with XRE-family HTH domain